VKAFLLEVLEWVFLPRRALAALERDVARIQWAQVESNTRLKELKTMTLVTDQAERGEALVRLWQLRDRLSVTDPDIAAEVHAIYNALVVAHPNGDSPEPPNAA